MAINNLPHYGDSLEGMYFHLDHQRGLNLHFDLHQSSMIKFFISASSFNSGKRPCGQSIP